MQNGRVRYIFNLLQAAPKVYTNIYRVISQGVTMLIEKVCRKFSEKKIPFAVVGGYAVALHGAVRGTLDLDLVIKQSKRSYIQVAEALAELGFISKLPVTAEEVFNFRLEYINNRNLIAWSFVNPLDPSEIVDIIITHDLAKLKTIVKHSLRIAIPVVAIDELIKMKSSTGREQDKADVDALERLK